MLTVLGVLSLFVVLWLLASGPKQRPKDDLLVFHIPNDIIANHRPAMSLNEREVRRRRILNEVFKLGFAAREEYEKKQMRDKDLADTPYYGMKTKY